MYKRQILLRTQGEGDFINLTDEIRQSLHDSRITDGICSVFVKGSTAAVTTIEYEPGVLQDLQRSLSILAPDEAEYAHNTRWGDGNGRSHVKASLIGPSLTIPVVDGELVLGAWQQVILVELDVKKQRDRTVYITILG
jgi:secondary thiamine-phosphate synthase enzyme